MLKLLSCLTLIVLSLQPNSAVILPYKNNIEKIDLPDVSSIWLEHIMDFVDLIEIDKVLDVAFGYMMDPEVLNFISFILSEDFKEVIWDFESIVEFKEAFKFLAEKGYEVDTIIDFINTALDLPPFEKPQHYEARKRNGLNGLIEDIVDVLPVEEMKKLFESKLETSSEFAELFETINSPEFLEIMRSMSQNPKFEDIKKIFEGYGFDFKYLCGMLKDILGEYYIGVFCDSM